MKSSFRQKYVLLAAGAGLALTAATSSAQGYVNVDASLTYAPLGGGVYSYSLTLANTGSESISSVWLGWTVNGFNVANANNGSTSYGWYATPYSDSIEFSSQYYGYQYYPNLDPGYSELFAFESTSPPADFASGLAGPSVAYGVNADQFGFVGTTLDSLQFTPSITVTPEPSTVGLVAMGALGLFGLRRRRFATVK
jgi:hypothetical protein